VFGQLSQSDVNSIARYVESLRTRPDNRGGAPIGGKGPVPEGFVAWVVGLGLLVLVGVPIAAVVVGLTLIGLPVAVSLVALYTLGLLLAWPALGLALGTQLGRLVPRQQPLPVLGALALGLIVLHLVTHLPFVGGLVAVCGLIFGLGLVVQALRRWRRSTQQPRAAEPLSVAA
jgi:hypothetical protein